jgi:hypothetical protein
MTAVQQQLQAAKEQATASRRQLQLAQAAAAVT